MNELSLLGCFLFHSRDCGNGGDEAGGSGGLKGQVK